MNTLALFLVGTLTGNELAVSAFVHPAISGLADDKHAASAQAIARVYGKYAPFWYGSTLLCLAVVAWRQRKSHDKFAAFTSAGLMLAALIFTLVGPVPINTRVSKWNLTDLPANWKTERANWDVLHAIRTAMLALSFLSLLLETSRDDKGAL